MTAATVDGYTGEILVEVPDSEGKRVEILATLVHTREEAGEFGMVTKGLFLAEGTDGRFKLWGTVPAGILDAKIPAEPGATRKGALVRFSAVIARSPRDRCFGMIRRPTKGEVLVWGHMGRERGGRAR